MNRNLWLLIGVQILFMVGNMMFLTLAPVLGKDLAGNPSFATLPLAISMLTMLVCSFPFSIWMGKIGRGPIFTAGIVCNAFAGLTFFFAIQAQSFEMFLAGSVLFGIAIASANFYRFAAMELVPSSQQSLAISALMASGVVAAIIGPNLGALTKDVFFDLSFSTSALAYLPISITALVLVLFIQWPKSTLKKEHSKQPINYENGLWQAILTAAVAYGVMVLIMSATPLHMSHQHYAFSDTAWVIQWHVIGMFAPSFFVNKLIDRLGLHGLIIAGITVLISSLAVNLLATNRFLLTLGLLLLGIGWNFAFLGASQWLMKLSMQQNASKIQGINEVIVFGFASLATFSSGWLINVFGWHTLNMAAFPILLLLLIVIITTQIRSNNHGEQSTAKG
ncbi:MFS transporter [Litoribacillus peritrichatus]|uniref:MFS transporter n=1 Tax=Litoribacillus peritrichatus TaxID=718191 RepID=A0ABP7M970_9GAMM